MQFYFIFSEKWVEENGVEPGLPGHGFTPKQFFWLSHAQVNSNKSKICSKYINNITRLCSLFNSDLVYKDER